MGRTVFVDNKISTDHREEAKQYLETDNDLEPRCSFSSSRKIFGQQK